MMNQDQFTEKLRATFNDYTNGALTADQASDVFVNLFLELHKPVANAKKHLNLFLYRVISMRDLQKGFFAGKKSLKFKSMEAEFRVDKAIEKLISELGYSVDEFKTQYEQTKLL